MLANPRDALLEVEFAVARIDVEPDAISVRVRKALAVIRPAGAVDPSCFHDNVERGGYLGRERWQHEYRDRGGGPQRYARRTRPAQKRSRH